MRRRCSSQSAAGRLGAGGAGLVFAGDDHQAANRTIDRRLAADAAGVTGVEEALIEAHRARLGALVAALGVFAEPVRPLGLVRDLPALKAARARRGMRGGAGGQN